MTDERRQDYMGWRTALVSRLDRGAVERVFEAAMHALKSLTGVGRALPGRSPRDIGREVVANLYDEDKLIPLECWNELFDLILEVDRLGLMTGPVLEGRMRAKASECWRLKGPRAAVRADKTYLHAYRADYGPASTRTTVWATLDASCGPASALARLSDAELAALLGLEAKTVPARRLRETYRLSQPPRLPTTLDRIAGRFWGHEFKPGLIGDQWGITVGGDAPEVVHHPSWIVEDP